MQSSPINIKNDDIQLQIQVEDMVLKTDINSFIDDSAVSIQNVSFPITSNFYYIKLSEYSKTFSCGNVVENLFFNIKKDLDNELLVFDFDGVEEISDNFYKSYTKLLLETSHKIITINMNTNLSNQFSNFINSNIFEVEE